MNDRQLRSTHHSSQLFSNPLVHERRNINNPTTSFVSFNTSDLDQSDLSTSSNQTSTPVGNRTLENRVMSIINPVTNLPFETQEEANS